MAARINHEMQKPRARRRQIKIAGEKIPPAIG
jgi:hypothetical protein